MINQPLGCRHAVVKDILLLQFGASLVPGFAILTAPPQIGHGVDTAHFQPDHIADRKAWGQGDTEAAITVEQGGILPIQF